MKKTSILGLLVLILAVVIISYKSQYLNTSDTTNSFEYSDNKGNQIEVIIYQRDTAKIQFVKGQNKPFETFKAHITKSASGSKYVSEDKQFSFWSKGKEATIFDKDEKIVFDGVLIK